MKSCICITGAAGGLGKAFAVECAQRGWDLFLTDLSADALSDLASCLSRTWGIGTSVFPCDLTDPENREELFLAMAAGGRLFRGLINVAGLDSEGSFSERKPEQIRNIVRLNIEANLELTHAVLKYRDPEVPFRLINVASLAAFYPMPVKATYAASKRFLLDFSLALREELRPCGGTVTVLCPAGMRTQEESTRAIDAQGLIGRLTTIDTGHIAARTVDRALSGRALYIPGAVNRLLRFLGGFLPPALIARLVHGRWTAVRERRFSPAQPAEVRS